MSAQSAVGIYDSLDAAEDAVRALDAAGFPVAQTSLVAQNLKTERKVHGFVTPCDVAKANASMGAWLGGIFGLLTGAAFLWLPGVGPLLVAGSLSTALLGSVEGAVAGAAFTGVLGWLAALGIDKQHILKYENAIVDGKYLVIAQGSADEVAKAKPILEQHGAPQVAVHTAA